MVWACDEKRRTLWRKETMEMKVKRRRKDGLREDDWPERRMISEGLSGEEVYNRATWRRTSTPHKSWNKMKRRKSNTDQWYLVVPAAWPSHPVSDVCCHSAEERLNTDGSCCNPSWERIAACSCCRGSLAGRMTETRRKRKLKILNCYYRYYGLHTTWAHPAGLLLTYFYFQWNHVLLDLVFIFQTV